MAVQAPFHFFPHQPANQANQVNQPTNQQAQFIVEMYTKMSENFALGAQSSTHRYRTDGPVCDGALIYYL